VSGPAQRLRDRLVGGLPAEVLVLVAVAFCVALGFGIVAPALPVFAKSFDVTVFAASAVISVFALVRLVSAPPAGWLVNRLGERAVLATGLAIVAGSSLFAGLSQTYLQLLLLRGVGGLGSAMFTVSAFSLLLRVSAPEVRGRASGAFQGGFLLGGVAGPAVGGLVTGISIRLPFFVYAVTLAAATVVTLVMLRGTTLRDKERAASGHEPEESITLGAALANRSYLTALAVNLGNGFTVFGLRTSLVPLFVVESLGAEPAITGYGLLASAAVQALLLLPAGRIADTRGRRPALVLGTAITLLGMIALAFSGTTLTFLLSMAVLGAGVAFLGSAPAAVVGDVTEGRRSGSVVAAFQMTSDFGAISGPLAAGAIVTATGSYEAAFLVGAGVVAVAVVLATTMPETRRPTAPDPTPATG
jgi:MFS family permease